MTDRTDQQGIAESALAMKAAQDTMAHRPVLERSRKVR